MKREAYQKHFELEENHWWFLGRRKAIARLLESETNGFFSRKERRPSILDVGCGTGGLSRFLEAYGEVWGIDLFSEGLRFCKMKGRSGRFVQGSALSFPFPAARFDLVVFSELLSQRAVIDDGKALGEANRVLKKGGYLLITDAAFAFLKGPLDRFTDVHHRYTREELRMKLENSGFVVERLSYRNLLLFPFLYVRRNFFNTEEAADFRVLPSFLNTLLIRLLDAETAFLLRWNLPFGSSLIGVAKKP